MPSKIAAVKQKYATTAFIYFVTLQILTWSENRAERRMAGNVKNFPQNSVVKRYPATSPKESALPKRSL